jgi:hypothetical protein
MHIARTYRGHHAGLARLLRGRGRLNAASVTVAGRVAGVVAAGVVVALLAVVAAEVHRAARVGGRGTLAAHRLLARGVAGRVADNAGEQLRAVLALVVSRLARGHLVSVAARVAVARAVLGRAAELQAETSKASVSTERNVTTCKTACKALAKQTRFMLREKKTMI